MRRVFQKSCECRIQQAQDRKTGREWVLQQDFKASSSGACTAMRWRPHTASLPAMILLGTEHGAKVQQSSLYGCHTLGCFNPCRIKAVSGSLLNYSSIEALFCMLCAVCCLLSAAQDASLHAMIPKHLRVPPETGPSRALKHQVALVVSWEVSRPYVVVSGTSQSVCSVCKSACCCCVAAHGSWIRQAQILNTDMAMTVGLAAPQVFIYVSRHMSWEVAAEFAEGHITDVAWAVPAGGQAPEFVATASGRTASVWKLAGAAEQLQVLLDSYSLTPNPSQASCCSRAPGRSLTMRKPAISGRQPQV